MDKLKEKFQNYEKYLEFIQGKLNKFFEAQSPYISCTKGCAFCCKNAQFPYSEMEFNYLVYGSLTLDKNIQAQIENNIDKIQKKRKENPNDNFKYDCPFLINDSCSVYANRGLVCRTFGLIELGEKNKVKIPFCHEMGLNYSNVVDKEKKIISEEKYLALNEEKEPLSYNISYKFLTSEKMEENFQVKFGEKKPLIDWFNQ